MAEESAAVRNSGVTWLTRAEAISVTIVSIIVALSPLALVVGAIYLAAHGHTVEAIFTAIAAAVAAGPKLIAAIKGNPIGDEPIDDDDVSDDRP